MLLGVCKYAKCCLLSNWKPEFQLSVPQWLFQRVVQSHGSCGRHNVVPFLQLDFLLWNCHKLRF